MSMNGASNTATDSDLATRETVSGQRTILVVEDDRVASKYLELCLGRLANYKLEIAYDVASALDILNTTVTDLILSDVELPDLSAYEFYRRVQKEARLRDIPFIFVSADSTIANRVNSLNLGAEDFIPKPFDIRELRARIERVIRRRDQGRRRQLGRRYCLAGDFSGMSFSDLMEQLVMSRRTGRLSFITPQAHAEICIAEGIIISAQYGNVAGEEAFYRIMAQPEGQFEFDPCPVQVEGCQPLPPCTTLLMEGARRIDTLPSEIGSQGAEMHHLPGECVEDLELRLISAPLASGSMSTVFAEIVADPFSLGELSLLARDELELWTESGPVENRVLVAFVGDLGEGVSTLVSMASPLTDAQLVRVLGMSPETVALSWNTRGQLTFDVLVLNQEQLGRQLVKMRRQCPLIIYAPRHGDHLTMGVRGVVDLEDLIERVKPQALFAIGDASTADAVKKLRSVATGQVAATCEQAAFSEPGTDPRTLLGKAVAFWATVAPASPMGSSSKPAAKDGR